LREEEKRRPVFSTRFYLIDLWICFYFDSLTDRAKETKKRFLLLKSVRKKNKQTEVLLYIIIIKLKYLINVQ